MTVRLATTLALALLSAPTLAQSVHAEQLDWLTGHWEQVDGDRWTEEIWTKPHGGRMLGVGWSGKGPTPQSFEHMRIEPDRDGTPVFLGSPSGGKPTPFRMVRRTATAIVFENAAHDFPQRISYTLERGTLSAEASRIDGSNKQSWTYRKVETPTR